jgi:hypothetical protein
MFDEVCKILLRAADNKNVLFLLYKMEKYSDYNIIPIGDHCAVSIILQSLNLRKQSYPFDWVTHIESLHDTNIIYNIDLIDELCTSNDIDHIVTKYLGNAFELGNKNINTTNNIFFPHDLGNIHDIFEKYKRRFVRLKSCLNQKNVFILLTRHYYIDQSIFQKIINKLLGYNCDSVILFISGTNHTYMNYKNVIFKYVHYDISQFYNYDYTHFRPSIENVLSKILLDR